MQQLQTAAHVFQCHIVAGFTRTARHGVADKHPHDIAAQHRADPYIGALRAGLHPVTDRIFKQWLQDQGGHTGQTRRRIQVPLHAQALAKAHRFHFQITLRQFKFRTQGAGMAHILQHLAENIA